MAVLLDFDGTVADTGAYWASAKRKFLRELGFGRSEAASIVGQYTGRNLKAFIEFACERAGVSDFDLDQLERKIDSNEDYIRRIGEVEGSGNFIRLCDSFNVVVSICTNSPKKYVELYLSKMKLTEYVTEVFSTYDNCTPKPSPEIYLQAIDQIAALGRSVLFAVEDSESGVKAATGAGLDCIWIGRSGELDIYDNVSLTPGFSKVTNILHDRIKQNLAA